jgi:hypothetical protein
MEVLMAQAKIEEIPNIKVEEGGLLSVKEESLRQTWVGDSGASCHMTNTEEGLHNWRPIKQGVRMGVGNLLESTKFGSITASWKDPETGRETQFELKEVKYVPGLWRNLFSVKSALKEGATLKSKGECMWWKKERST